MGSPTPVPLSVFMVASLSSTAIFSRVRWASFSSSRSVPGVRVPSAQICWTVIRFWVSVPVLSEQITCTEPRLSTAFSSLMMACCRAIFWVPMASTMVTMELSASGMAATASATANIRASNTPMPLRNTDSRKTAAQITMMTTASLPEKSSRFFCSGVLRCWVSFIRPAMRPSWVSMPVPVTTMVARP